MRQQVAPECLDAAASRRNLGDLAVTLGDLDTARERYLEALAIEQRLAPSSSGGATCWSRLGNLARRQGKLEEARDHHLRAVQALEAQRARVGGSSARAMFSAGKASYYHTLMRTQLELGEPQAAFETLERSRARSLMEMIASRWIDFRGEVPAALLERRDELAARRRQLYRILAEAEAETGVETVDGWRSELLLLPGSQREVERIARLFGSEARTLLGSDATEAATRTLPRHTPLLHFACHGLLSSELPLDSALALSLPAGEVDGLTRDGRHDGLLQAWEVIQDLRLDSDCVVLSACDTGVGRVLGGEGVMGFTRAIFHAGARSVVVSLWPIADDSTAALMEHFYGCLREGSRRDVALHGAQHALMKSEQHAHPFFWAAFQLHGRAD